MRISRQRRIALALHGYRSLAFYTFRAVPGEVFWSRGVCEDVAAMLRSPQCYEAMDEADETIIVSRGNFGLPCA